jgi:hypothetical protein
MIARRRLHYAGAGAVAAAALPVARGAIGFVDTAALLENEYSLGGDDGDGLGRVERDAGEQNGAAQGDHPLKVGSQADSE